MLYLTLRAYRPSTDGLGQSAGRNRDSIAEEEKLDDEGDGGSPAQGQRRMSMSYQEAIPT